MELMRLLNRGIFSSILVAIGHDIQHFRGIGHDETAIVILIRMFFCYLGLEKVEKKSDNAGI